MAVQIQVRRDTAANWTSAAPTLAAGEIGFETDTGKFKIGDGSTAWASLDYFDPSAGGASTLDGLTDVVITAAASGDILRHNGTAWVDTPGTTHFEAAGAVATHEADTTSVHGIADTSALATTSSVTSAISAHESDTTSVHGISDTSALYRSGGTDVAVADGGTGASTAADARTNLGLAIGTDVASLTQAKTEAIGIACSDETTALTTGTAKVTFRMPFAMTLTAVRASVTTASTTGGPLTVDINEAGSTILSTKLTIDDNEKTSTTAATAAVISDSSLADDAEMTIDIDTAGTGAAGLKVWLIGTRA